ncbi:oligodendrocyte transcription factor 2 [Elysia marginata]|uniref:Oligodendrocyte transcription factor 2 n=1 Tax=Elysia marginata TaxID=1093978 RepID=A0AAV4ERG1_9GAST|nr:oligodendrocyte transcription factor 2 [Elysia marginata]
MELIATEINNGRSSQMNVVPMEERSQARAMRSSSIGNSHATVTACDTTSSPARDTYREDVCEDDKEESSIPEASSMDIKADQNFNGHSMKVKGDGESLWSRPPRPGTPTCSSGDNQLELHDPPQTHALLARGKEQTESSLRHVSPAHSSQHVQIELHQIQQRQFDHQQKPFTPSCVLPGLQQTAQHLPQHPHRVRYINNTDNIGLDDDSSIDNLDDSVDDSSFSYPSSNYDFYHSNSHNGDHLKSPAIFGSKSKVPEEVRLRINSRERQRMHDLNSALDSLRQVRLGEGGASIVPFNRYNIDERREFR